MEKLQIPTEIQQLVDEINSTKLQLGELPIDKHPEIPLRNRSIIIDKMVVDLKIPRTQIWYSQQLTDDEGNIVPSNLPTPDFIIDENETSSIRDGFDRILVPIVNYETEEPILNEDGTPKMSPIFLNSHKYLIWLQNNDKIGFLNLIKGYMSEKLEDPEFKNKLDKLV